MNYSDFIQSFATIDRPVILLEGRRTIDKPSAALAMQLGTKLAGDLPHAIFRSGNATGSDEAFSRGVSKIAPERLEIIAPYASHRLRDRIAGARYVALSDIQAERASLLASTIAASPDNKRIFRDGNVPPAIKAKGDYLLRDTLKVLGSNTLQPANAALFFIDEADPMAGGTGHTIRVCQSLKLPIHFQSTWNQWL